jgi:hypothetical protein
MPLPELVDASAFKIGQFWYACVVNYGLRKGHLGLVAKARTNATIGFSNATNGSFNTEFTRTPIAFASVIL